MRNKIITVVIITGILLVSGTTSVMAQNISGENTGDMQNHKCSPEMMTNMDADYPKDIMSGDINTMMGGGMMGDIDRNFIEQMIPHHQMAITEADIALQKAEHEEIKMLAADIKTAQAKEIDDMRSWYKEWYGTEVPENSTGMGDMMGNGMMGNGMMDGGMMGRDTNIESLNNTDNFDKEFIEQMVHHHQMAIMMADIALQKAEHEEIKKLAMDIKTAQAKEIDDMRSWYKEWYGTEVPSMGMGMMGRDTNIERLNNADNFDKEFIEQMISHHQMAIMMADIALQKAEHEEIKKLAMDIKTAQAKEIDDMRSWYKEWYGTEVPENSTGMEDIMDGGMMDGGMMDGGMMGGGMMGDE